MKILICIKQVPDTTEIRIDPVTNSLIRAGVPSILNPFDGYALEAAARIRDKYPDTEIIAVSMGPEQASDALRECLSVAADRAYLVCGRIFSGSDTLATSYILSEAIKKIEEIEGRIDAVFCGKQAIDGDTAQVGPEIAEHLGYPQVTYGLEAEPEGTDLRIRRETEDGYEVVSARMPCLVTFTKPVWEVRYPTIARKLKAEKAEIVMLGEEDFPDMDKSAIGLSGSPTRVKKTFVPNRKKECQMIRTDNSVDAVQTLFNLLNERLTFGSESEV